MFAFFFCARLIGRSDYLANPGILFQGLMWSEHHYRREELAERNEEKTVILPVTHLFIFWAIIIVMSMFTWDDNVQLVGKHRGLRWISWLWERHTSPSSSWYPNVDSLVVRETRILCFIMISITSAEFGGGTHYNMCSDMAGKKESITLRLALHSWASSLQEIKTAWKVHKPDINVVPYQM